MINSKLWLVVQPTVGLPLFLGAVAVGSFAVHVSVLTNTTWVADFLAGRPLGSPIAAAPAPAPSTAETTDSGARVYFQEGENASKHALIVLPDGRHATVVFEDPTTTAAAAPTLLEPRPAPE